MSDESSKKPDDSRLSLYERVIFGGWDQQKLTRQKGLMEQAADNDKHFAAIQDQNKKIDVTLSKHAKFIRAVALLGLLPVLNSAGIDTKALIPAIIKMLLGLFGL